MAPRFTDLTVKIRMLTRTCACGETGEFPFVRTEIAVQTQQTSFRAAEKKRNRWWEDHAKSCNGIPVSTPA